MSFMGTAYVWTLLVIGILLQESYGKNTIYEFVFCVPETHESNRPRVLIATSSPEPVNATVRVHGTDFERSEVISRDSFEDIWLPDSVYIVGTGIGSDKTVVVTADAEISVHVTLNTGEQGDLFLVLPAHQLGTDHYVLSHVSVNHPDYFSYICVSTLNQNTSVEIKTNEETLNIMLQPYQSYQLVSLAELSGIRVSSDNPIFVIAATHCGNILNSGCDALVEQIPSIRTWGTRVILSPFASIDNGYIYRVIGTNTPTEIMISNLGTQTLSEGQWYEGVVIGNDIVTIDADYPILVMQYFGSNTVAPSMILAPSINMYLSDMVTFPVFPGRSYSYFIHVITDCAQVDRLKYDDSSMSNWERLTSSDGLTCSVRGPVIADAVHRVSNEDKNAGFTIAVYGLKSISSFAYLAGIGNEADLNDMPTPQMTTELAEDLLKTQLPKVPNPVSGGVIIPAIVGGVVVVVIISLLCFCLIRNRSPPRSPNENASPDYATSIPLSNTASVPEPSDKTPDTRELNTNSTEDDFAGYEKPLDNSGYMDIDSSAVKQSTYQGLYVEVI